MKFIPTIRKDTKSWRIVDITMNGKTGHNVSFIAKRLKNHFEGEEGVIFICNSKQLLVLVKTGSNTSPEQITTSMNGRLPKHSCTAKANDITAEGLHRIHIDLQELEQADETSSVSQLLIDRQRRAENVVMVVDDDSLISTVVAKTFLSNAKVIEYNEDGDIVEMYLEHLPDIIFLDIHMPGISGIDVLSEILSFDDSAHVVMISADSTSEKVLSAKKLGARGYIRKPFTKDKLHALYNTCPTVHKPIGIQQ